MKNNDFLSSLKAAIDRLEKGGKIGGEELASLVISITEFEVEEGGPYAFVEDMPDVHSSEGSPNHADVGLNLLIAYFLSLCEVDIPKLSAFLDSELDRRTESALMPMDEMYEMTRRWQALRLKNNDAGTERHRSLPNEERMMDMILEAAKRRFGSLSPELRDFAIKGIQQTIRGNHDNQMSLMSYYTKQALGEKAESISDASVAEMGLANIFFWTAFIIYDDFWDEDEAADPHILPAANLYARNYVDFFSSVLPEDPRFRIFFHGLMDALDGANTWETVHCRTKVYGSKFIIPKHLPDYEEYENKFLPSSGHILGPVSMLVKLGYDIDSPEIKNLIAYFRNYLIAMQINDDVHDWEEDMRRGHLSTVVVMLLEDLDWPKEEIDLDADLAELKKVFWFKTITKAAKTAIFFTEQSKRALAALSVLENPAPLEKFITINEEVARKALEQQKNSMDFLKVYKAKENKN